MLRNVFVFLFCFFLSSFAFGAFQPTYQFSNLKDKEIGQFVNWMRSKNYKENIISRWVEDYANTSLYPIFKQSISYPKGPMTSPITIKYIDIMPIDTYSSPDPVDINLVTEYYKNTFGMNFSVEYSQYPLDYVLTFGNLEEKYLSPANGTIFLSGLEVTKFLHDFADKQQTSAKYILLRFAINRHKNYSVTAAGGATTYVYVGNENPNLYNKSGFRIHAEELAHLTCLATMHHYDKFYSMQTGLGYGTYGPLSLLVDKTGDISTTLPIIDPLTAYQIEPIGGFDFPSLILGDAYYNNLKKISPLELPYADPPIAQIKLTKELDGLKAKVKVKNTGNIPLSFIPIKITLYPIDQAQPLEKTQTIYWLKVDEEVIIPVDLHVLHIKPKGGCYSSDILVRVRPFMDLPTSKIGVSQ